MSVLCSSFMRLGFYGLRMWASFYLCEMRHLLGGPEHSDMTSQFATKNPSKQFKSLTVATAMYSVIIAVVTVSDFNCFDGFFFKCRTKKNIKYECVCVFSWKWSGLCWKASRIRRRLSYSRRKILWSNLKKRWLTLRTKRRQKNLRYVAMKSSSVLRSSYLTVVTLFILLKCALLNCPFFWYTVLVNKIWGQ